MGRATIAFVVGLGLIVAVSYGLVGAFGLEVITPREVGDPVLEPPPKSKLATLVLLHLAVSAVGGAVAALLAPAGKKMMTVAFVAFFASLAVGLASTFAPVGPIWYAGLHFACAIIGPPIGGMLLSRGKDAPPGAPTPARAPDPEPAGASAPA